MVGGSRKNKVKGRGFYPGKKARVKYEADYGNFSQRKGPKHQLRNFHIPEADIKTCFSPEVN